MKAQAVRLGDVCDFIRGVTFPRGEAGAEAFENSIACLTTSGVQQEVAWESRRFIPRERVGNDRQILRAGDILISTANSKELVGKSCIVRRSPFACTFGAFVTVARPKELVLPDYLAYWMRTSSFLRWCLRNSSNTTNISNLRVSDLGDLIFPLPSLSEQQRMVGLLAQADRLRRTRRYALELGDAFLPAAFLELFGDLRETASRYHQTTFGNVVEATQLGLVRGATEMHPEFPYDYLRMDAIVGDGSLYLSDLKRVRATPEEVRDLSLQPGDFLFNTRNSRELVGKTALYFQRRGVCLFNNNIMRIRFKERVLAEFMLGLFQTQWLKGSLERIKSGTTSVFAIYYRDLAELPIVVPPPAMQRRFALLTEQCYRLQARQREALRQAEHLFQSLLHRTFSGDL